MEGISQVAGSGERVFAEGTTVGTPSTSPTWRATFRRALPPVRLLWLVLVGLGIYGSNYLGGLGATSLVVAPVIAGIVDLGFQSVRYDRPRFPDSALATGLFIALIFPPNASLVLVATVAFAAVAFRHVLRYRGRPWFNPAATGILLGTLFLGLAPAWWVGIGPYGEVAVVALGIVLLARTPRQWRIPAVFLATYGLLAAVQHVVAGTSLDPHVLLLQAVDPATLFFAFFMVVEPRTAPGAAHEQVLYAGVIGVSAAFLPLFMPSLGILVALLGGNILALVLRRQNARVTVPRRSAARSKGGAKRAPRPAAIRWPASYRIGAGILSLIVVTAVVAANPIAHSAVPLIQAPVSPVGGGGSQANCQTDNPSIPASELSQLHKLLGPSVILSYDSSTGVVVFYDPVNHVTVTESDLYEDYGFAEFNGDDYAVSGCAG
ncbi:MAG TPA: RnfABCDGE type electron transport complex subunit D [Thermoplasmata archaeon]|nr:RnfABCDGE type electron transport complex subunit D [Thermoplasmata archaeon]